MRRMLQNDMCKPANSKLKQNEDEKHEKDCRAKAKIDGVSHKKVEQKGEGKGEGLSN